MSKQVTNQIPNPIPRIDPEFKALIPPLSPEEYTQLEQNILADKKCRDAIVVWDNTIVDGHNRFCICAANNIPFEIKEISFDSRKEAMVWILDNQLGRRNLSDAMRIELALSKMELLRQQAKENIRRGAARGGSSKPSDKSGAAHSESSVSAADEVGVPSEGPCLLDGKPFTKVSKHIDAPINVHKAVADDAGVSHGTVQNYMEISKHGSPELLEGVKTGGLKIGTAHRLLDSEIQKRLKRSKKLYSYIEENIPRKNDPQANREIKARLEGLLKTLESLKEAYNAETPRVDE